MVTITAKTPAPLAGRLAEVFPHNMVGWTSRDLPLGPTEFAVEISKQILGFDDYINREYSNGPVTAGVYIAYWQPGKITARMVRGHIPDNCWVAAGWQMTIPADPHFQLTPKLGLERRSFMAAGQTQDVAYVQIVDGEVHSFSKTKATGLFDDLMHYWDWDSAGKKDQYFIRISTTSSLDDLTGSKLLEAIEVFVKAHATHTH
ncbi:MAG: exosortase-associated EpsI family protein [Candidatus Hydrogenedentes bacterium]|nr:exosortase-associated EpsI family protein [Candidatus Hydrogenedentota bacterium]